MLCLYCLYVADCVFLILLGCVIFKELNYCIWVFDGTFGEYLSVFVAEVFLEDIFCFFVLIVLGLPYLVFSVLVRVSLDVGSFLSVCFFICFVHNKRFLGLFVCFWAIVCPSLVFMSLQKVFLFATFFGFSFLFY